MKNATPQRCVLRHEKCVAGTFLKNALRVAPLRVVPIPGSKVEFSGSTRVKLKVEGRRSRLKYF